MNAPSRNTSRAHESLAPAALRRIAERLAVIESLEARVIPATLIAHWIGGSGNWSDPTHWDIGKVPNNGGGDTYNAIVDLAASNPIITVNQNIAVDSVTNSETIRVTANTSTVAVGLANTGTIEVSGTGTLTLAGTFTVADLGTINGSAGTVQLAGTLNNAGATLALNATTGSWQLLEGATINGGIVTGAGGAGLIMPTSGFANSGATLNGVRLDADLSVLTGGKITVVNGLTLNGEVTLSGYEGGNNTTALFFSGTQTLAGTGSVVLDDIHPPYATAFTGISPISGTLTIGPDITIHGGHGRIGDPLLPLINRGTISGDAAGRTIFVTGSTVTNHGTMRALDGGSLSVSNLMDAAGLSVSGAGTLLLDGTWANRGIIDVIGGGTLTLAGAFTTAELGTIRGSAGTVQIAGTLNNTGATLALNATTGSWRVLESAVINGGTVRGDNGAGLIVASSGFFSSGVTFNGVTLDADVTVREGGHVTVVNGLTVNGTVILMGYEGGNNSTVLNFSGTQTLDGTGDVVLADPTSFYPTAFTGLRSTSGTLTIRPQITIHGGIGRIGDPSLPLINQGTVLADIAGRTILISASTFTNEGSITADNGGVVRLDQDMRIDGAGRLASNPSGVLALRGSLLGNTGNADLYSPRGTFPLEGFGTLASPQLLEVMSRDLGNGSTGGNHNFAYGTLVLANNTRVKLVDESDNSEGTGGEALYVSSLVVPSGTTLDLNGLHLYARTTEIAGTIVGGTVSIIPDGGSILPGVPASGVISAAGEVDQWTFFGRSGHSVTVLVSTGSGSLPAPVSPALRFAEVRLLDAGGNVLATGSNINPGNGIKLDNVALSNVNDGTYRLEIRASDGQPTATGNYVLTVWDSTTDSSPLVLNQQTTGRIENPFSSDRWTFSAAAGQQVQFDLLGTSSFGIAFDLKGPAGFVGFDGIEDDSQLVTLPRSGVYELIARSGSGEHAGAYSFRLSETSQTQLTLGTTYQGTLVGSGHAQLFRVNVPEQAALQITLDDNSTADRNELYVKLGSPPTRSDFDFRSSAAGAADQQVVVPTAAPGTWYVLVYGDTVPAESTFSLTADADDLFLTAVTPDHHGNGAAATLTLTGGGFDRSTAVSLVAANGAVISPSSFDVDSTSAITATFAAGLPAGTYDVRVTEPGETDELQDAFQIAVGGQAQLTTNLVLPEFFGVNAFATVYVEYANTGNVAMDAPLLTLEATARPRLTLDSFLVKNLFFASNPVEPRSETIQILASGETPGILQPGESMRVPVYFAGIERPFALTTPRIDFTLEVLRTDDSTPINWTPLKDDLRPASITPEAWTPIFNNFVVQAGGTGGGFVSMLDDNAAYLGRLGERVIDVGELIAFEFQQANGISPIRELESVTDVAVQAPGLDLSFSRVFSQTISQRYDTGPFGHGWSHNWEFSLERGSGGAVTINGPNGSTRIFQPDIRGGYFVEPGDHGILTALPGGTFSLQESSGLITHFRTDGKLDYVQDTNGNRITAAYTGGLLASLAHSSGKSLGISYDSAGHIARITDPFGRSTSFSYDTAKKHLLSVTDVHGETTSYRYELGQGVAKEHALAEITYPGDVHQFFAYDASGRIASTSRDGGAERVSFSYDSAGKVSATDGLNHTGSFFFDHRGLLLKVEDPLGNAVSSSFDREFNVTQTTGSTGLSYRYSYDSDGNLARSTDPLGHVTEFGHAGPFDRLTSLTDANGNLTRYGYDAAGNLTSITYADNAVERWDYDSQGNPDTWTNARGHAIGYEYDDDGRVTAKLFADGSRVDYDYDARGNLIEMVDPTGTTTFVYDPITDRPMHITYPGNHTLDFTYNSAGQRASSLDELGHQLDYGYDDAGRLESLTDETGTEIVHYSYDSAGRLSRKDLGNDVYTIYGYDAAGQVLSLVNYRPDGTVLSHFDYTYNDLGRRDTMTTNDGKWTYSYDATGQLIHAVLDSSNPQIPDQDLIYVYDAMGNRVQTIENGLTTAYTTNNRNQYTQVGDATYQFDADGNIFKITSAQGVTIYAHTDENHLVGISSPQGNWQYTYDGLDSRVATTTAGGTSRYIVDPLGAGNVFGEYDAAGGLIAHNNHGLGLISRSAGTSVNYYTFDAIGNVAQLTGLEGSPLNSYAYTPFGRSLASNESIPNAFRYVGEHGVILEKSTLSFMRARFSQADIGRFIEKDPLGLLGGDVNLYRYVSNNPVSLIDPIGLLSLSPEQWRGITGATIGIATIIFESNPYVRAFGAGYALAEFAAAVGTFAGAATADLEMRYPLDRPKNPPAPNPPSPPGPGGPIPPIPGFPGFLGMPGIPGFPGGIPMPGSHPSSKGSAPIIFPGDPNEKAGPAGFGEIGYLSLDSILPYRIDFENDFSATAPAQRVVITDQLETDLNWNTFELTEIGFGDNVISIPAGSQHYQTTATFNSNGRDFEVQIEAGLRAATGEVFATFQSLDPLTDLPPDVLTGFLPPEDGTGRGMGHVSYIIKPMSGLTTGTEIRNVALITFDGLETIATNQVDPHDPSKGTDPTKEARNTIDADAPTSTISAASATQAKSAIKLTFQSQDIGSGVASFDVFVSDNGGAYLPALVNLTGTTATYLGKPGHEYRFYSVAHDHVGNTEAAPANPDTTVTLAPSQQIVLNKQNPKTKFTDEDGTLVNVVWTGPGAASVERFINPANERGDIFNINIAGSTTKSNLTITPVRGDTSIGSLKVRGDIGALNLAGVNLLDHATFASTVASLSLGNLVGGADVTIGGALAKGGVAVSVGDVSGDSDLLSASAITSLKATRWMDGEVAAPSIGTLTISGSTKPLIAGDFGADLTLTSTTAKQALGKAAFSGSITGGTWEIAGNTGNITAFSTAEDWSAAFDGNVAQIKTARDASGHVTANAIANFTVGGNLENAEVTLTQEVIPNKPKLKALQTFTIKGAMEDSSIVSAGHLGTVTVGALRNSTIFAGVKTGVGGLPDSLDDFDAAAAIAAVTVKGIKNMANTVANSDISAQSIGSVALGNVMTANDGNEFGVAADKIAALTFRHNQAAQRFTRLDTFDKNVDDFVVRAI